MSDIELDYVWIDITYSFDHPGAPHPGAIHFKVTGPGDEQWSGWADGPDDAHERANRLRNDMHLRLTGRCYSRKAGT